MDELDVTAAETKATYDEIPEYVKEHTGLNVNHLYIVQVKQKYGIKDGDAEAQALPFRRLVHHSQ